MKEDIAIKYEARTSKIGKYKDQSRMLFGSDDIDIQLIPTTHINYSNVSVGDLFDTEDCKIDGIVKNIGSKDVYVFLSFVGERFSDYDLEIETLCEKLGLVDFAEDEREEEARRSFFEFKVSEKWRLVRIDQGYSDMSDLIYVYCKEGKPTAIKPGESTDPFFDCNEVVVKAEASYSNRPIYEIDVMGIALEKDPDSQSAMETNHLYVWEILEDKCKEYWDDEDLLGERIMKS